MKLTQPSLSSPSTPVVSALALAASSELGLVRSGLVAEYRFNEGSGQILYDYSGNNNHGTLGSTTGADTNDPTYTGQGASFTTDDYIAGPGAVMDFSTGYTVQIVVNCSDDSAYYQVLSRTTDSTSSNERNGVYLRKTATANQWGWYHHINDATRIRVAALATLTNGTWGLLSAVWTGTQIYLGVNAAPGSPTGCTSNTNATDNMRIGGNVTSPVYYSGLVAYVLIYSRTLTQAEITQNYNYLKGYLLRERGISLA